MSAETWIGIGITGYCAFIFIILGIVQLRSKKPVGFWTGETPPAPEEVTDVRAYNRGHGRMWIGYGLGFLLAWILGSLTDNAIGICAVFGGFTIGGLLAAVWCHRYLCRKYVRKRTISEDEKR